MAVLKKFSWQHIFDVARLNKSFALVLAVCRNRFYSSVENGLHKRSPIIKKVGALANQCLHSFKMRPQSFIDTLSKLVLVLREHFCSFFKSQALRAVPAVVNRVARRLV